VQQNRQKQQHSEQGTVTTTKTWAMLLQLVMLLMTTTLTESATFSQASQSLPPHSQRGAAVKMNLHQPTHAP
jgi:hypothetical protein